MDPREKRSFLPLRGSIARSECHQLMKKRKGEETHEEKRSLKPSVEPNAITSCLVTARVDRKFRCECSCAKASQGGGGNPPPEIPTWSRKPIDFQSGAPCKRTIAHRGLGRTVAENSCEDRIFLTRRTWTQRGGTSCLHSSVTQAGFASNMQGKAAS